MKLAEALSLRSDLNKRIEQLNVRIKSNVRIQEGEEPAEDPKLMLEELPSLIKEFERLVLAINRTNMSTVLSDGTTLTSKIAHRDALVWQVEILQSVMKASTENEHRYSRSEIKMVRMVDVQWLRKEIDVLSKQLRQTDMIIQSTNWQTDLIE